MSRLYSAVWPLASIFSSPAVDRMSFLSRAARGIARLIATTLKAVQNLHAANKKNYPVGKVSQPDRDGDEDRKKDKHLFFLKCFDAAAQIALAQ